MYIFSTSSGLAFSRAFIISLFKSAEEGISSNSNESLGWILKAFAKSDTRAEEGKVLAFSMQDICLASTTLSLTM